jgi:DNA invertase Pin-like site-specific DNA recombinase
VRNLDGLVALVEQLSSHSSTLLSLVKEVEQADDRPPEALTASPSTHRPQLQRRLSSDEIADLVVSYQAGTTVNELARIYRINRTTILEHLRRQGVQRRRPRRLQPVDIDKAVRLYVSGTSIESIAHELRVGPTTVRRVLRQAGVELRQRGRPRR